MSKLLMLFLIPLCAIIIEVDAQIPITNRVIFVVDRSGSMHGDHFTRALNAFKEVSSFATDDLEIAIIAFNDTPIRWPGKPETGTSPDNSVPPGWARLPSRIAITEGEAWLSELGAGGDTHVMPALSDALQDPRNKISIILITDGLFGHERRQSILDMIRTQQNKREQLDLDHAVIGVYGIGSPQRILYDIAEVGRGGYIREE